MKFKAILGNPMLKKGLGIAGAVVSGVVAVVGALADQKKAAEFEDMKKAVSELQKQVKGS